MKPRGPLMHEHRLIEKMIEIIRQQIDKIKAEKKVDSAFIDTAVDFIRIYADKTHHGKEEEILFRECKKKSMSDEDAGFMNELVDEHKYGRKTVAELLEAKDSYIKGEDTLGVILDKLKALVELYPQHIEKEDNRFFPNSENYFSKDELDAMLDEFWDFDKTMIHEKYKLLVESLS